MVSKAPEAKNEARDEADHWQRLEERRRAEKAAKVQKLANLRAKQTEDIKIELNRTLTSHRLSWQAKRAIRERVKAGLHPLKGTRICPW